LQVWRGALLLNDFILHNPDKFSNKTVLELGSGVGISSIVASIYAKKVICTDINVGGILDLIKRNLDLNKHYQKEKSNIEIMELNFLDEKYESKLDNALKSVNIALAADGKKTMSSYIE
jgi:methyltransferase-like protein 22